MTYGTVLFDLDGTLVDTKPGILKSVKQTMADLGLPCPADDRLRLFMGPPLRQCFTEVCGLDESLVGQAVSIYRKYYVKDGNIFDSRVYAGIPELLAALRKRGCRLGVATSKAEPLAEMLLSRLNLKFSFDAVCGPSLEHSVATKADSIRSALKFLNVSDPRGAVLVGDRMFDAQGAAETGIDAIGVLYGYGSRDEIKNHFSLTADTVESLGSLLLR